MQPDIEAKMLLTDQGCKNCEWMIELDNTLNCLLADKYSPILTDPIPCPKIGVCSNWEQGYQDEWLENAMQGGSSIGIMDEKGKPTFYDATGAKNIEISGRGVYIDGRKIQ